VVIGRISLIRPIEHPRSPGSWNDEDGMSPSDCPFCRKLAHLDAVPEAELVWGFPHSVAFLGTWQYYPGYCVLIARSHARELSGLADDERRAYLDEMCLLARAIETALGPHKLNYELLGNQVPHLHWHLFPRYLDDPDRLRPVWLALDRAENDEQERRRLEARRTGLRAPTQLLRQALKNLGAPTS
jgi:diadenosine tetraphosphate (Ap4A) HIT family hydrolase